MDIFFNNTFKNFNVNFYFKDDEKFINYTDTNLYYNNKIINNKSINLYQRMSLFKKILISKNERCLLKSASLINKKQYKKALVILNKYNEKGDFLTDIYALIFITHPDLDTKKELLEKIIYNLDSLGNFFHKYNIRINFSHTINDNIYLNINDKDNDFILFLVLFLKKIDKSKKALDLLLTIEENRYPLYTLLLGELYLETENYVNSIVTLQNIDSNEVICIYSLLLLGRAFRKEGLLKSSIAILRKTRRRSNRLPIYFNLEGRYQLALSLEEYNKYYLAKKEYEKILTINYNYKDTRKRLNDIKNI